MALFLYLFVPPISFAFLSGLATACFKCFQLGWALSAAAHRLRTGGGQGRAGAGDLF